MVISRNLKREGLIVLELRAAVQPDAGNADRGELDREDITLLAVGIVARRAVHGADSAVRKGLRVEVCGVDCGAVVPQTDRVLAGHVSSPEELSDGPSICLACGSRQRATCRTMPRLSAARWAVQEDLSDQACKYRWHRLTARREHSFDHSGSRA